MLQLAANSRKVSSRFYIFNISLINAIDVSVVGVMCRSCRTERARCSSYSVNVRRLTEIRTEMPSLLQTWAERLNN